MNKSYKISLIGVFAALTAVSAFIRIPMPLVPFTMQVLIVLLIPMLGGVKVSFGAIFLYLLIGLSGIPIFANGGGISYVLQPSFGFLVGFLVSTIPNGIISAKGSNKYYFLGGFAGLLTYQLIGGFGLWWNLNYIQMKDISLIRAYQIGSLPFIPVDILRLACAVYIAGKIKKYAKL